LLRFSKEKPVSKNIPVIIPRAEHTISRNDINRNALKVLYRLHSAGFSAYLVGGCVRDLLFGRKPKDFDIATDAHPEEVRKLFKNCRLIGRRFRLAHILFGREIIEVATFRTHHENGQEQHGKMEAGMIIRDNVYGTIEDDAWRRDFRINALYYNIADFSVIDYTGGIEDIKEKVLHMIGDPMQRFHEDPVRILRAVRFLAKLDLNITKETEEPLTRLNYLLSHVSSGRLFQEVLKFFQEGASLKTFYLLLKYKLFPVLFPATADYIEQSIQMQLLENALKSTDLRVHEEKSVSPAFLFAVFLWAPLQKEIKLNQEKGLPHYVAHEKALHIILKKQVTVLAIPRAMQISIRDICVLQHRLTLRRGSQPFRLLDHPRFRAGYDLLLLRAVESDEIRELADWWTKFYSAENHEIREALLKEAAKKPSSKAPRRWKKHKK